MKVHYVTMVFPAPSETFASNDVRALRRRGIRISVHALLPKHARFDALVSERALEDVQITHGGVDSVFRGLAIGVRQPRVLSDLLGAIFRYTWQHPNYLAKSLALVPRVMDVFADLQTASPDVVHIYWGHYPSLVGFLVQRHMPGTVVTMSLAAYDLERRYGVSVPVAKRAARVRTLANVNIEAIRNDYGVPADRIVVIPDGLDLDLVIAQGPHGAPDNRVPGIDGTRRKRIITAGSLTRHKKMDDVIRVFATVNRLHPTSTLSILGDGPERASLQELCRSLGIADAVTFHGYVEHSHVHREMAASDVFVFMSQGRGERLPNVVKEAMANRCVCVVSDTPGIEELIPDQSVGFVVRDGNDAAAAYVDQLFRDPESMQSIAESARQLVLERFDREESVSTYIHTWKRLIRNSDEPSVGSHR